MHIPVEFQTEPLIEMFLLKKSYSFSCFCDTFQDKRIPFPLRCTFAFLPYAPRKMFIQQLCNKDHVMRTILSYNRRVPPKNGSKLWFFWGGGGSRLSLGFFLPFLKDHLMRIILCLKDHVAMIIYDEKILFSLKICLHLPIHECVFFLQENMQKGNFQI